MHGNVYEWCHDYYEEDYYKQSPEKDPTRPAPGSSRVLRGGSYYSNTRYARSAIRDWSLRPDPVLWRNLRRPDSVGFRLVRELD